MVENVKSSCIFENLLLMTKEPTEKPGIYIQASDITLTVTPK